MSILHSTNYFDTLILVSPDCLANAGLVPPKVGTVAALHLEMILGAPYAYTSDDVIFGVFADRKGILQREREPARDMFFSKGQACLRSSALVKTYGWGVHSDDRGRVALFGVESKAYGALVADKCVKKIVGMRSKRA